MKTFRDKEVDGWTTITLKQPEFDIVVNDYMEKYNFEDYQFSTDVINGQLFYSASMLLSEK